MAASSSEKYQLGSQRLGVTELTFIDGQVMYDQSQYSGSGS